MAKYSVGRLKLASAACHENFYLHFEIKTKKNTVKSSNMNVNRNKKGHNAVMLCAGSLSPLLLAKHFCVCNNNPAPAG